MLPLRGSGGAKREEVGVALPVADAVLCCLHARGGCLLCCPPRAALALHASVLFAVCMREQRVHPPSSSWREGEAPPRAGASTARAAVDSARGAGPGSGVEPPGREISL